MRSAALLQSGVQRTLQQSSLRAVRRACPIAVPQQSLLQAPRAALAAWHCSAASPPRPSTLHVTPRRWISSVSAVRAAASSSSSSSSSSADSTASSLVSASTTDTSLEEEESSDPDLAVLVPQEALEKAEAEEEAYLQAEEEMAKLAVKAKVKAAMAARPPLPADMDEDAALQATLKAIRKEDMAELLDDVEELEEAHRMLEGPAEDAAADKDVEAAEEDEDELVEEDESLLLEEPEEGDEDFPVYAEDYAETNDIDGEEKDIDEDEDEDEDEYEGEGEIEEQPENLSEQETLEVMSRPPNNDVFDERKVWESMQESEVLTTPEVDEDGNLIDSELDLSELGPRGEVSDLHRQGIDAETLEVLEGELEEEEDEEEDAILDAAMRREQTWGMTNKQAAEFHGRLAKAEKDAFDAATPKRLDAETEEQYEMDEDGNFTKMEEIRIENPEAEEGEDGEIIAEGEDEEDVDEDDELDLDADLDEDFDEDGAVGEKKKEESAADGEEKEEAEEEDPLVVGRIKDFATIAAEAEKEADKEFAEMVAEMDKTQAKDAEGKEGEDAAEGEATEADSAAAKPVAEWVPPTETETLDMLARQAKLDAAEVAEQYAMEFAPGSPGYSQSKEDDPLGVDEANLTPEERQKLREEIQVARQDKQEMLDAIPRISMTDVEDKVLGKRDEEEILAFLTKLKLQDHAEKFHSMQTLLHVKSWELKEMGLTVKQRKQLLRVIDRFKMSRRVKQANDLIRLEGAHMEPAHLQAAVYRLMYPHIYSELDWRAANAAKEAEWRARIAAYREDRRSKHSIMNGLREPDLMELAKMEATMMRETLQMHKMGYRKQSEIMKNAGLDFEGNPIGGEEGDLEDDEEEDELEHFEEEAKAEEEETQ